MTGAHTSKRFWKKTDHKNLDAETVAEPERKNKRNDPSTPPPPYTERSSDKDTDDDASNRNTPYPVLTRLAEETHLLRRSHFHWVLVDIMAVTFSTDCGRLKKALVKTDPSWGPSLAIEDSSSMLDKKGKSIAVEMCALVRALQRYALAIRHFLYKPPLLYVFLTDLVREMARGRWLLVDPRDKYLVRKMVLEPIQYFEMDLNFALELIGRFERGDGCSRPESTLLGYWMTWPYTTDLGDIIASHGFLLQKFDLEIEVRLVLEDYFVTFQKEKALEELCTSKELQEESLLPGPTSCWPLSDEYIDLARGLRAFEGNGTISDPYESSRTRLKERRSCKTNWIDC